MHSIPEALIWEMSRRGRWRIPLFFILGNTLPMVTYAWASRLALEPQDRIWLVLHVTFLPVMIFQFAIGILMAQGSLSRLYAAPVSTSYLVACQVFSGGMLLTVEVAASLWIHNLLFEAVWPILGPSLFAGAVWAVAQILVSVSHRTVVSLFLAMTPILILCGWMHSRYGSWFSPPQHHWLEVTLDEATTLLVVIAFSFFLTVSLVSRERCGEQLPSLHFGKWLARILDEWDRGASQKLPPFETAEHAQNWYEWQLKGLAMPFAVVIVLFVFVNAVLIRLAAWGDLQRNMLSLHEALVAGGPMMAIVAGVAGMMLGHSSTGNPGRCQNRTLRDLAGQQDRADWGHFLSTRPFSNSSFARVILRTAIRSLLISWLIWVAAFSALLLLAGLTGNWPQQVLPEGLGHWYLPLTLLGPWIAMTNIASLSLSGRGVRLILWLIGTAISYLVITIFVSQFGETESRQQFDRVCAWTVSLIVVGGTLLAFFQARKKRLMQSAVPSFAAVTWLILTILAFLLRPAGLSFAALPLLAGFSALVVLPWATTPLAIAWNRHR